MDAGDALRGRRPAARLAGTRAAEPSRPRALGTPVGAAKLGAALLLLVILAGALVVVRHIRTRELAEAERDLASFNDLLAEQTARTFQSVALVLDGVADDLQTAGLADPGDLERIAGGRDMFERLRQRITGIPQLDAVTLIASDGHLVNFSRGYPIPAVNVADRDYFRALNVDGAPNTFLGQPVPNRGTGTLTIYLARRLSGPTGKFGGLVLGAMELGYFEAFYRDLHLAPGTSIGLWRQDGLLLAHYPPAPDVGQRMARSRVFRELQPGEHRSLAARIPPDEQELLLAMTRLSGQPMVVSVARSMETVLADWRFDAALVAAAGLACAAAVLGLAWLLIRQFRTYEATHAALRAREAAERSLRQAEARLVEGQKLEAVGRLTAGVAHDFNNLLTVVRANAELLQGGVAPDPKAVRRLNTICQAVDRGAALTRQMLAFSRQQILSPSQLDVNGALRGVSELLLSSLGSRVRLEMQLARGLWPAYADGAQLEQAILNLVINARDATEGAGLVASRTTNDTVAAADITEHLRPGEYVAITVADTGAGMTPEVMSRAFDPFFTTKEQGKGTGLGLSQVVGFARQSGGDVQIESSPGRGTRVRILLPRDYAPAAAVAGAMQPAGAEAMPAVLLVDDDPLVRAAAAGILRRHGFAVEEAGSGTDALRRMAAEPGFDLVLTDYAMPEMTGAELARRLRRELPARPVVFMTGFAEPDLLRGERWVIRKPFEAEALCRLVADAWRDARGALSSA